MQKYCDIMPHATGWVYMVDGVESASSYHTYELALEAARVHLATRAGAQPKIFRYQGLDGVMLPVHAAALAPNIPARMSYR